MTLIEAEQDVAAVLAAEDKAIAEAANPKPEETVDDIAALIERLTSDEQDTSAESRGGGAR